MHLYLIQHAEAKSEAEDPERGLSERGLGDIRKVATYASHHVANIDQILHSGQKRSIQTAQYLAEHLYPTHGIAAAQGLAPLDDPSIIAERLRTVNHDTVIVGHLPHLSKFASMLLGGEQSREVVSFRMAGIVCLEKYDDESTPEAVYGKWAVRWMIVPEIIG